MGKFQRKYTLFLDATVNKVDAKGRVSIPADYRALLEQQETELVAFRSFTMPCIECRTSEMMEKWQTTLTIRLTLFQTNKTT